MKEVLGVPANTTSTLLVSATETIRIDRYLARHFTYYSRTFFAQLINKDLIMLNSTSVRKPSMMVKEGDTITITFPAPVEIASNEAALHLDVKVLFEHEHFLIVNKGPQVIVHKPTEASTCPTLVDWLLATCPTLTCVGPKERPGIVHRLDKDTSGLLIIARTNYAHTVFGTMFKQRTIEKSYIALVEGHPEPEGSITHALGRSPFNRTKMAAFPNHAVTLDTPHHHGGIRAARSDYTVLQYFDKYALVAVKPLTGRTHQIRVHMAAIGHPIVGDSVYGNKSSLIARQALHAHKLSFTFDGTPYSFSHDVPLDFTMMLNNLSR